MIRYFAGTIFAAFLTSGLGLPPQTRADFLVRDVRSTGQVGSLAAADALLGGRDVLKETTGTRAFIDMFDRAASTGEGRGRFANDQAFPGDVNDVAGRDFAVQAVATIIIEAAGTYTFGVNSDDGSRLRIDAGGGFTTVIQDSSIHAPRDIFGKVNFATAGEYALELVYFQRAGQATVELFAAAGNFTSFGQTSSWRLVGDAANGGLATVASTSAVPEPAGFALLAFGLVAGGLVSVRRRRPANATA